MRLTGLLLGILLVAPLFLSARADEQHLATGQLESQATDIVSGTVKGVYASEKEKGVTRYVIEIAVQERLKGEGPKAGEVLYVRCWKRNENSKDGDSKVGQSRIPSAHHTVFVYTKRAFDGGFDALEPNGIRGEPTGK
jgi:hypothetical protein